VMPLAQDGLNKFTDDVPGNEDSMRSG
jgi:hypothetical protein